MYYILDDNNKVKSVFAVGQQYDTIHIQEPRPSEHHQPTFDGEPSTDNFTGWVVDNDELLDDLEEKCMIAVQLHIDSIAQDYGYDDIKSAISYLNSTITEWSSEADSFNQWRDAVWLHCLNLMQDVRSGEVPTPTDEDEVVNGLPDFTNYI